MSGWYLNEGVNEWVRNEGVRSGLRNIFDKN